jgi:ABC-type phosphate transport system permease subunit
MHGARSVFMAALVVILLATIGLAVRAATYSRQWSAADSEPANETGFVDTCARTFVLVLLSLLGLFALGVMYGNVLGSAHASP